MDKSRGLRKRVPHYAHVGLLDATGGTKALRVMAAASASRRSAERSDCTGGSSQTTVFCGTGPI